MRTSLSVSWQPVAGIFQNSLLTVLLIAASLSAAEPESGAGDNEATSAQKARLAAMKRMASRYQLAAGKDGVTKLELTAEPLLRWSNPVRGGEDGCLYLFVDKGRPQAALSIYPTNDKQAWNHEFQSLAETQLAATKGDKIAWRPDKPGVEFKSLPDAPVPAESATRRLAQMRSLADHFSATVDFRGDKTALRRLSAPVYRYGSGETDPLDGAVFVFAQATDPELLLLLEARKSGDKHQWHYAVARSTMWVLEVEYGGRQVWTAARQDRATASPEQTYYDIARQFDE